MLVKELVGYVGRVIYSCADETEFAKFTYKVEAGAGWEWITAKPALKAGFTLPKASISPVRVTDQDVQILVYDARVGMGWSLGSLSYNGAPLQANTGIGPQHVGGARSSFFADLVKKLGESITEYRAISQNPAAGTTFSTGHEGGITLATLHGPQTACFLLSGEISNGWNDEADVANAFVQFVERAPNGSPGTELSKIGKEQADQMLGNLENQSGGNCLLGVMIADIKNDTGRVLRVASISGNMCGSKGSWVSQTTRQQASQMHMEIFHLERLGKLIEHLKAKQDFTMAEIDIGILGKKTNTVVNENVMCGGCQGTKVTEIDNRLQGTTIQLTNFNVAFLKA